MSIRPNIFDRFLTQEQLAMRDARMNSSSVPEPVVSKETAYRQDVYSNAADKKGLKQRALPFLQKSIDDAFGESDISDFSKFSSDQLADGFMRACIIDYLYGAGSINNAWKAVYALKDIPDRDANEHSVKNTKDVLQSGKRS
jgi:hypothetical protein